MKVLQEDCADLAGEVNRLEDLNFLAETALLKYAGACCFLSTVFFVPSDVSFRRRNIPR